MSTPPGARGVKEPFIEHPLGGAALTWAGRAASPCPQGARSLAGETRQEMERSRGAAPGQVLPTRWQGGP